MVDTPDKRLARCCCDHCLILDRKAQEKKRIREMGGLDLFSGHHIYHTRRDAIRKEVDAAASARRSARDGSRIIANHTKGKL